MANTTDRSLCSTGSCVSQVCHVVPQRALEFIPSSIKIVWAATCVAGVVTPDVSKKRMTSPSKVTESKKTTWGAINPVKRSNNAEDPEHRCECLRVLLHQVCLSPLLTPWLCYNFNKKSYWRHTLNSYLGTMCMYLPWHLYLYGVKSSNFEAELCSVS